MAVNGVSTVNVSHQQAVEALKAAGGVVTLVNACICFHFSIKLRWSEIGLPVPPENLEWLCHFLH